MKNTKELSTWLDELQLDHPLVIAGPCSAETEDQLLKISHELKNSDVSYFRAGIWKPRTRPGNFEGVGALGLKWLQKVKAETGLKIATEVANAAHVKLALEHDVDLLWVGARSTVSPFIVQEIADALQATDKIVLVKNPVHPDLALWIGGIERLHAAGIKNLGLVHRGFHTYEKTKYRNNPGWQIAIELQNRFPDLPLLCDPSHITGKREMVFEVSQTALDLNFKGLMIETHFDPDNAWSDAAQQITPASLIQMMKDLRIRKSTATEPAYKEALNTLRAQIDVIDHLLVETFGKRMKIADKIGRLKKEKNVAVLQSERWNEILKKMILEGEAHQLSKEFILNVFKAMHQESIDRQEKVMKQ